MKEILAQARRVFEKEILALEKTKEHMGDAFIGFLNTIMLCDGKIILTGMGKSGHIAKKIAATFSSLGTPSFYIHPAESLQGDLVSSSFSWSCAYINDNGGPCIRRCTCGYRKLDEKFQE